MIEVPYVRAGSLPPIPVLYVALRLDPRVGGPAIVDTGFDGGLLANLVLAAHLKARKPAGRQTFWSGGEPVECDVFEAPGELYLPGRRTRRDLGVVRAYLPRDIRHLGEEVLLGREVLNRLVIRLDGRQVRVE